MAKSSKQKVFVIGLDGATFDVIIPLVNAGRLPTFARIMSDGVWCPLESTIPPSTAAAWPSFSTGKNPGKHGSFNFLLQRKGSYRHSLVNAHCVKAKRFWEYLKEAGYKIGLMDIPITYPPEEVNGFIISGMPLPSEVCNFTYPYSLHTELVRELGDYPLEEQVVSCFKSGNPLEALKRLYFITEKRKDATLYLMEKFEWDFFMVVFRGPDLIQHRAFRFADKNYCQRHPEESKKFGDVINQFYEKIDCYIREIMDRLHEDCAVIIMSDHGAGPIRKHFYINKWLIEEGLLRLKSFHKLRAYEISTTFSTFGGHLRRFRLSKISKCIPRHLLEKKVKIPVLKKRYASELVDWNRTKAYSNWFGADPIIRINLKGRELRGIVESGRAYEDIRDLIITRLYKLRDPDTKEPIIERIYKKEEIYSGEFMEEAPDLLVVTKESGYPFRGSFTTKGLFHVPEDLSPSTHRINGIFLINGKNIRSGVKLHRAHIMDLAPTILYLFGLPVLKDMDGSVLSQAFNEQYLKANPILTAEGKMSQTKEQNKELFSPDEKKSIEDVLKGLGYMS